jgi:hypothetical protein
MASSVWECPSMYDESSSYTCTSCSARPSSVAPPRQVSNASNSGLICVAENPTDASATGADLTVASRTAKQKEC